MPHQAHILMCPPDYYGVEYEINPWMSRRRPADFQLAVRQWEDLRSLLIGLGAKVSLMPAVEGLPDLVFTANAALIYRDWAILSHFRPQQRQGELPHDAAWFEANGYEVMRIAEQWYVEGAGDALFCGDTLVAGYRIRSDAKGQQEIGKMIGQRVIPLELVDQHYYHLDTCFCPLKPGLAIYYPPAFDAYAQKALGELVDELIVLEYEEAACFAANAVVIGSSVVTNTGCPNLHRELAARGFRPVETPLSEFVKAGGSAKCLTLRLDGEEAAGWKYDGEQEG